MRHAINWYSCYKYEICFGLSSGRKKIPRILKLLNVVEFDALYVELSYTKKKQLGIEIILN